MAPRGTSLQQWKKTQKKTQEEIRQRAWAVPVRRPIEQVRAERPAVDSSRLPMFAGNQTKALSAKKHEQPVRRDSANATRSKATTTVANPGKRKASDEADNKAINEPVVERAKLASNKPLEMMAARPAAGVEKKAGAKPATVVYEGLTVVPFSMLPRDLVKRVARARREELPCDMRYARRQKKGEEESEEE